MTSTAFSQFHFLRPWWLLAAIPVVLLAVTLWQRKSSGANWRSAIAPELIGYLLESVQQLRPQWPWLLLAGWLLGTLALAGPTWEKLPQPVLQKRDGLVIVLDMSLSMYAEDIKPSRLQRARFKIADILQQRREGLTGLVAYAGDAHVVSPLTDDVATIENLVPALSPSVMPSYGSNVIAGIDTALRLLRNSGFERGRILLISDEIAEADINSIAQRIDGRKWQLGIIGVGTEQGAPMVLPNDAQQSGFVRNDDGSIAIAKLHRDRFDRLAKLANARYDDIRFDDSDIARVLPPVATDDNSVRTVERDFDQWRERGPQWVMLLLPLAAFAFRRGWLIVLCLIPLSTPSHAWEWRDLWLRPDQQAQRDFSAGNSKAAADKFQDPKWRGAAQYRSGDFAAAAESLHDIDDADAQYNRGNALAHAGHLQDALAAYDAALKKNPAHADARTNRDLVEKLLKDQSKNQQNNPSQRSQSDRQQQDNPQSKNQPQNSQAESSPSQSSPSPSQQQQNQSQQNSAGNEAKHAQNQANASQPNNQTKADGADRSQKDGVQPNANQTNPQQRADLDEKKQASQNANASQREVSTSDADTRNKTDPINAPPNDKDQNQSQSLSRSDNARTNALSSEQQRQQRATEQWLRQIPDDPSGLLRRKFLYENQQKQQQPNDNGKPLW